ncbi:hypothetical protein C8D92_102483 [Tamilnaduibacter salinus]|uniref:Uncharacterized protein n=1 Tax=Tamilnaduibacter salinus TaxID=1484056 RepID=A0A2U1D067_9GAMM|nr:hypothetical protein C8D92_102483 [Tamilnaduibacter salinus]
MQRGGALLLFAMLASLMMLMSNKEVLCQDGCPTVFSRPFYWFC